jgi:histidine kinase/DNA gyrase B/HSP90-like ATPase
MVLSSSHPTRSGPRPVALADVVYAAVAEVDDHPRNPLVQLRLVDAPAIAGWAVDDVVQLVAELVENAVVFSPPQANVEVTGQTLGDRYALRVKDRGIGMSDETLARVNRHLADPPLIDLASYPLIGLLAAGRVAHRHGIQVRLSHARLGATDALVLLPATLLLRQATDDAEQLPIYDAVRADWLHASYDDPDGAPPAEALPTRAAWQPDGRLPRRTPMANLDARLQGPPGAPERRPAASRSPDETRSMLTSYQDGLRQVRSYLQRAHADTAGP